MVPLRSRHSDYGETLLRSRAVDSADRHLEKGNALPTLSTEQAEYLAHCTMNDGNSDTLLKTVLDKCRVNLNSTLEPGGMSLLGKAILYGERQATCT